MTEGVPRISYSLNLSFNEKSTVSSNTVESCIEYIKINGDNTIQTNSAAPLTLVSTAVPQAIQQVFTHYGVEANKLNISNLSSIVSSPKVPKDNSSQNDITFHSFRRINEDSILNSTAYPKNFSKQTINIDFKTDYQKLSPKQTEKESDIPKPKSKKRKCLDRGVGFEGPRPLEESSLSKIHNEKYCVDVFQTRKKIKIWDNVLLKKVETDGCEDTSNNRDTNGNVSNMKNGGGNCNLLYSKMMNNSQLITNNELDQEPSRPPECVEENRNQRKYHDVKSPGSPIISDCIKSKNEIEIKTKDVDLHSIDKEKRKPDSFTDSGHQKKIDSYRENGESMENHELLRNFEEENELNSIEMKDGKSEYIDEEITNLVKIQTTLQMIDEANCENVYLNSKLDNKMYKLSTPEQDKEEKNSEKCQYPKLNSLHEHFNIENVAVDETQLITKGIDENEERNPDSSIDSGDQNEIQYNRNREEAMINHEKLRHPDGKQSLNLKKFENKKPKYDENINKADKVQTTQQMSDEANGENLYLNCKLDNRMYKLSTSELKIINVEDKKNKEKYEHPKSNSFHEYLNIDNQAVNGIQLIMEDNDKTRSRDEQPDSPKCVGLKEDDSELDKMKTETEIHPIIEYSEEKERKTKYKIMNLKTLPQADENNSNIKARVENEILTVSEYIDEKENKMKENKREGRNILDTTNENFHLDAIVENDIKSETACASTKLQQENDLNKDGQTEKKNILFPVMENGNLQGKSNRNSIDDVLKQTAHENSFLDDQKENVGNEVIKKKSEEALDISIVGLDTANEINLENEHKRMKEKKFKKSTKKEQNFRIENSNEKLKKFKEVLKEALLKKEVNKIKLNIDAPMKDLNNPVNDSSDRIDRRSEGRSKKTGHSIQKKPNNTCNLDINSSETKQEMNILMRKNDDDMNDLINETENENMLQDQDEKKNESHSENELIQSILMERISIIGVSKNKSIGSECKNDRLVTTSLTPGNKKSINDQKFIKSRRRHKKLFDVGNEEINIKHTRLLNIEIMKKTEDQLNKIPILSETKICKRQTNKKKEKTSRMDYQSEEIINEDILGNDNKNYPGNGAEMLQEEIASNKLDNVIKLKEKVRNKQQTVCKTKQKIILEKQSLTKSNQIQLNETEMKEKMCDESGTKRQNAQHGNPSESTNNKFGGMETQKEATVNIMGQLKKITSLEEGNTKRNKNNVETTCRDEDKKTKNDESKVQLDDCISQKLSAKLKALFNVSEGKEKHDFKKEQEKNEISRQLENNKNNEMKISDFIDQKKEKMIPTDFNEGTKSSLLKNNELTISHCNNESDDDNLLDDGDVEDPEEEYREMQSFMISQERSSNMDKSIKLKSTDRDFFPCDKQSDGNDILGHDDDMNIESLEKDPDLECEEMHSYILFNQKNQPNTESAQLMSCEDFSEEPQKININVSLGENIQSSAANEVMSVFNNSKDKNERNNSYNSEDMDIESVIIGQDINNEELQSCASIPQEKNRSDDHIKNELELKDNESKSHHCTSPKKRLHISSDSEVNEGFKTNVQDITRNSENDSDINTHVDESREYPSCPNKERIRIQRRMETFIANEFRPTTEIDITHPEHQSDVESDFNIDTYNDAQSYINTFLQQTKLLMDIESQLDDYADIEETSIQLGIKVPQTQEETSAMAECLEENSSKIIPNHEVKIETPKECQRELVENKTPRKSYVVNQSKKKTPSVNEVIEKKTASIQLRIKVPQIQEETCAMEECLEENSSKIISNNEVQIETPKKLQRELVENKTPRKSSVVNQSTTKTSSVNKRDNVTKKKNTGNIGIIPRNKRISDFFKKENNITNIHKNEFTTENKIEGNDLNEMSCNRDTISSDEILMKGEQSKKRTRSVNESGKAIEKKTIQLGIKVPRIREETFAMKECSEKNSSKIISPKESQKELVENKTPRKSYVVNRSKKKTPSVNKRDKVIEKKTTSIQLGIKVSQNQEETSAMEECLEENSTKIIPNNKVRIETPKKRQRELVENKTPRKSSVLNQSKKKTPSVNKRDKVIEKKTTSIPLRIKAPQIQEETCALEECLEENSSKIIPNNEVQIETPKECQRELVENKTPRKSSVLNQSKKKISSLNKRDKVIEKTTASIQLEIKVPQIQEETCAMEECLEENSSKIIPNNEVQIETPKELPRELVENKTPRKSSVVNQSTKKTSSVNKRDNVRKKRSTRNIGIIPRNKRISDFFKKENDITVAHKSELTTENKIEGNDLNEMSCNMDTISSDEQYNIDLSKSNLNPKVVSKEDEDDEYSFADILSQSHSKRLDKELDEILVKSSRHGVYVNSEDAEVHSSDFSDSDDSLEPRRKKKKYCKQELKEIAEKKKAIKLIKQSKSIWKIQKELNIHKKDEFKKKMEDLVIENPFPLSQIQKIAPFIITAPTRKQREKLEKKGIQLKLGFFSEQEDDMIMQNWKHFCEYNNWDENDYLPFINGSWRSKYGVLSDIQLKLFAQWISHGFENRTMNNVFFRFQRIFSSKEQKYGQFTEEEDRIIMEYMKISHSSKPFADIATILNRSRRAVMYRHQLLEMKNKHTKILWTKALTEKLIVYLTEVTCTINLSELKDRKITSHEWLQVGERMKLPAERVKRSWLLNFHPRFFTPNYSENMNRARAKLIDIVASRYSDWKEIDWNTVANEIGEGLPQMKCSEILRDLVKNKVPLGIQKDLKEAMIFLKNEDLGLKNDQFSFLRQILEETKNGTILPRINEDNRRMLRRT